jgi:hypothetical protein
MQIDVDMRLAAAAGGAARYFADAAGLGEDAVAHMQAAVVAACEKAFHELGSSPATLDVTLTRLVDRIEVSVAHKGGPPPNVGRTAPAGAAAPEALDGVDEVQQESHDGIFVTRLTKFIKQGAASR